MIWPQEGQFGPPVSSLPLVFTLTCTAAPQLWVSLQRVRERERETGSHFTRIGPISSLIACQLRVVWLQAKLIKTKQLSLILPPPTTPHIYSTHGLWHTHTHSHTHSQEKQDVSRILDVIFLDSNGILMEHRCLLRVALTLNTHEMTQYPLSWFNHLMIIMSLGISSCSCFGTAQELRSGFLQTELKDLIIKWWESRSPWQPHKHASDF